MGKAKDKGGKGKGKEKESKKGKQADEKAHKVHHTHHGGSHMMKHHVHHRTTHDSITQTDETKQTSTTTLIACPSSENMCRQTEPGCSKRGMTWRHTTRGRACPVSSATRVAAPTCSVPSPPAMYTAARCCPMQRSPLEPCTSASPPSPHAATSTYSYSSPSPKQCFPTNTTSMQIAQPPGSCSLEDEPFRGERQRFERPREGRCNCQYCSKHNPPLPPPPPRPPVRESNPHCAVRGSGTSSSLTYWRQRLSELSRNL